MESHGFIVKGEERRDRQTRLVFKRENLLQLRDAMTKLFDIFYDILEKDFQYGSYFTHKDILKRLEDLEKIKFEEIRTKYLDDDAFGYRHGQYKDNELKDPAKLLLDLINGLDLCKKGMYDKIEEKHIDVKKAEETTRQAKDEANKAYKTLLDERQKVNWQLQEAARNTAKLQHFEQLVKEKSEKIAEFQRVSAISMWEKEKEKVLEDSNAKIESLQKQIESMKLEKQLISRKMSDVDSKVKLLKLKQEKMGPADDEVANEMDKVKRESFLKDKDINHLESEVFAQQKLFLGMVGGIRTDINMFNEKFYNESTKSRDPEFVKLLTRLDKIYNAAAEGVLLQAKTTLPPHYTFFDTELRLKRVRRLSLAKSNSQIFDATKLPSISDSNREIRSISDSNKETNGQIVRPERTLTEPSMPTLEENPVIVDPATGKMNGMMYLKFFPHMSQGFILDHWSSFKKYDKNNDGQLDLSEVVKILRLLGTEYTPDQLIEAMDEVDMDHSQTLDFYEYLLVVEKIMKKTGKAMIFKKGLSKQNNVMVSKTCSIQ